jgi:hypothetical protein
LIVCCVSSRGFDRFGIRAPAPVGRNDDGIVAEVLGQLGPERGELTGFGDQHLVSWRERVDERGLPGARSRSRIDDHRLLGLEDLLQIGEQLPAERAEFRPAVIDRGPIDCAQNTVRHVRGTGDLQEMAAAGITHVESLNKTIELADNVLEAIRRAWSVPGPGDGHAEEPRM